jgi:serine/threonine protein kinase
LAVIAHGGMGTVLRAWDDKLQREVALKVIGQRWLDQPTARQRFLQEARAAAGLRHPNIVTIHEVDEVENVPFIVMEYVCGKSLDLLIAEERQLASDRAARIARETLTALEHAHGHGIIHRDVKPGNILLEEPGERVRLVDFGLARSLSDAVRLTGEGFVPGTPWYMSPEQASGSATADKRSDLFAVGVVLFEMLTGTLPFPGQDVYRVLEQIRAEPAPEVREFNPAVPSALATIVRRALEKSPAARYQSAAEFAGAIGEFLAGLDKSVLSGAPRLVSGPSGPATGAAGRDRDFPRCSVCRRTYFSKLSVTRVCLECQAPICDRCWEIDGMIPRRAGCGPG